MYKAMLVDDEKRVRSGLRRHFPWSAYGVSVEGEAASGLEAWEWLRDHPVDMVITDVRMPQMDGIELARRLKERDPGVKVIFVSGYDDLDYLKSALKVEAIDYILKSIDLDQLGETIRRVTAMLDRERAQKAALSDLEDRLKSSMPLLQEKLLMRLIRDEPEDAEGLEDLVRYLGLNLSLDAPHAVMVLSIDNFYTCFAPRSEHERQLLSIAVRDLAEEVIGPGARGTVFESERGEFTVILPGVDAEASREALCALSARLLTGLKARLDIEARVGIGRSVHGYANLREGYLSAGRAVNTGVADARNGAVRMDEAGEGDAGSSLERLEKRALIALQAQRADFIDTLCVEVGAIADPDEKRNVLFYLLMALGRFAHLSRLDTEQARYRRLRDACEHFFCCRDDAEMLRTVFSRYHETMNQLAAHGRGQEDFVIARIKALLQEKFSGTITIAEIAQQVFLTPTYVCQLFKRETGMTINEYLTELRMEKAKEMLSDVGNKQYDVCYAVGYASPSYFTRLFKKHTGLTPNEYRDRVIR